MSAIVPVVGATLLCFAIPGIAFASASMMPKAKNAGLPAQNCQYCHIEKMPKKDTFKMDDLNERGKFLMEDKKARSLKEVDVEKLKDFKGK